MPEGFIYQSNNKEEFERNIIKAVKEDSLKQFNKRISFINKNTWNSRVKEILKMVNNLNITF